MIRFVGPIGGIKGMPPGDRGEKMRSLAMRWRISALFVAGAAALLPAVSQ
jgi:hypothetical protein